MDNLELKLSTSRDLPVLNKCEICEKEFFDEGCGICGDCYWAALESVRVPEDEIIRGVRNEINNR